MAADRLLRNAVLAFTSQRPSVPNRHPLSAMTLRLAQAFTISLLAITQAGAQPSAPHFDVASVKRYPADQIPRGGLKREITPTSITLRTATLGNCFEWAFGMPIYQVIGPKWLNWPTDAAYDITAKVTAPASQAELKLMMQALMTERFHLAFHRETRNLTVYAVLLAKSGPKFQPSTTEGEPSVNSSGLYAHKYERISMAQLAASLERPFQPVHVVDETGLQARFDFALDLAPYILDADTGKAVVDSIGRTDEAGALIRALPQQLGIRLEKRIAPIEVLVIDHLEKDPTAN
jgi:uncharacterized protein (TIGR03435 family)